MSLSDKVWPSAGHGQDDLRLSIIALLDEAGQPVGARELSATLRGAGFNLSPSTTARRLRDMDDEGLTQPIDSIGRVLTPLGKRLARRRRHSQTGTRLAEAADIQDTAGIVNLLKVRRAIEPEAVLDATASITDSHLAHLRTLVQKHRDGLSSGEGLPPQLSLSFHRAAAQTVKNPLLAEIHDLIFSQDLERIDVAVDLILEGHHHVELGVEEHAAIIEAMASSDGGAAAALMRAHLERLIEETNQFVFERGVVLLDTLISRGR